MRQKTYTWKNVWNIFHSFYRPVSYKIVLLLGLAHSIVFFSFAGEPDSLTIDIAKIRFYKNISKNCFLISAPKQTISNEGISSLRFDTPSLLKGAVPDSLIEKECFVKFSLTNSSDSAKEIYFIPGFYLKEFLVFRTLPSDTQSGIKPIPVDRTDSPIYPGSVLLRLSSHEKAIYFARFEFLRSNTNTYSPQIIEKDFLKEWLMKLKNNEASLDTITYVVSGILLLMIFYSLAVYLQNKNKEFIFYSAYAFCTVVLLFLKSFLNLESTAFNFFYEEYLDFIILCAGVFFYLIFVRKFLNTKENYLFLEKSLRTAEIILVVLLFIFSIIYFFTEKYIILNIMENYVIKLFLFMIGIAFIVYSINKKNTLLNYLAAGNIALVFFSIISLSMLLFKWRLFPQNPSSVFNRAMLYYEEGLVFELMFFLSGLAYKNRRDIIEQVKERERFKMENERKEFEKQMAVLSGQQEERDRISADMHDELGSGVTSIRLMSEIVKSKMKTEYYPEIDKISNSANELLGKMNIIIWTMKSSNDTLESLVAYIRAYAVEYFDTTPISCSVQVNEIPDVEMTGEKRRNIFLGIKEALTNILKHSQASQVHLDIEVVSGTLFIRIKDNGIGIDTSKLKRFGNGLNNMKRRMQTIHGEFTIETNGGTLLCFALPI